VTTSVRLRAAVAADAVAIHATVIDAWRTTVDPRSSGHRLTIADVSELLRIGGGFVAETADGALVGSVMWAREGDTVELMKLAVVPGARSTGVGPALVRAVEAYAAEAGATQVLLAVSAFSPRLVAWYEHLGYAVSPAAVYAHASPLSPPPTVLTRGVRAEAE
jgi:GNAT superfamily N-acetyltransferase